MKNCFRGCIYGLAIGDALGWPKEGTGGLDKGKHISSGGEVIDLPEPALYTDDTQMSLALARALLLAGQEPLDVLMDAVRSEFIAWAESPENDRAPGGTCMRAISRLKRGIPWQHSGIEGSKGCGTAMRTAPIGLYYHGNPEKLRAVAEVTSIATHRHPASTAGGVATAYLVSLALDSTPADAMIPRLLDFAGDISEEFNGKIEQVQDVLTWPDTIRARSALGQGWVAEEAVALALYCFLKSPSDYKRAVLLGANTRGDSDSIACIAGAISGAYNGEENIRLDWRARIEKSGHLAELADALYRDWQARN